MPSGEYRSDLNFYLTISAGKSIILIHTHIDKEEILTFMRSLCELVTKVRLYQPEAYPDLKQHSMNPFQGLNAHLFSKTFSTKAEELVNKLIPE